MQRGLGRLGLSTAILGLVFVSAAAAADCDDHAAGPPTPSSKLFYSSSCYRETRDRVQLIHKVCSVSNATLVFYWSKLNWVSGATGVEYGNCLTWRSSSENAKRIGGSRLTSNQGSPYDTDVFLPDLKAGNQIYFASIEGGGPRIEGGSKRPFRFAISYAPNKEKKTVQVRAGMNGERPVFYLILPRSVKSSSDLNAFVNSEYIKKITPLVQFGDKPLVSKTKDAVLMDFFKNNDVANRNSIIVGSGESRASLDLIFNGTLEEIAGGMAICLSQAETMISCSGPSFL